VNSCSLPASIDDRLARNLEQVERECRNCTSCVSRCAFLKRYGCPSAIARKILAGEFPLEKAFACSLCRLCSASCKHQADPHELFLEMRRACVRQGHGLHPEHNDLTAFEKAGTSRQLTWAGLPTGSRKVFFPGCTLSGSRPAAVRNVFELLQQQYPGVGIVLDCCTKPSHDLGRDRTFRSLFGELRGWLIDAGVEEILTACPSCQQVFEQYGAGLKVRSVYEALLDAPQRLPRISTPGPVKIHDPCSVRFSRSTQQAVREMCTLMGLEINEMPHHRTATLCCGKGGGAHRYAPSIAATWLETLNGDVGFKTVVTYCSSCQARFQEAFKASHLLDFLTHPEQAVKGEIKPPAATLFHINRLRLKHYFRRNLETDRKRERDIAYPQPG